MKEKFRPGDRLKTRDIAEQLGTSVTPVRDAILRLTHDEARIFETARTIRVPLMTKARYLELLNIRLRLESFAAEKAATADDIANLENLLRSNVDAIHSKDWHLATELNQSFHFCLSGIAQMPMLQGILKRCWLQMGPIIANVYATSGYSMVEHHFAVVDAIKRNDKEGAAKAITNDIGRILFEENDEPVTVRPINSL